MGLLGFLRNKRPGSPRRAKKGKAAESAVESGKRKAPENESPDATNSTEPESGHHEGEDTITENLSPDLKKGSTKLDYNKNIKATTTGSGDSDDVDFEIVESPLPKTPLSESRANEPPKDDKSVLEKFKAKNPVPRGNNVAARAAWLQNSAFKEEKDRSSDVAVPTSREITQEKKRFWEGRTFHKETSKAPESLSIRTKTDVQAKKKWLEEVAFTPSGGGNMEETDGSPDKRKHTMGLLPASPDSADGQDQRTAKDLLKAMQSYDEQQRLNIKTFLEKEDDPYEWAYEVWFRTGLLPWRTSTYAEPDDTIYQSLLESQGRKLYSPKRADLTSPKTIHTDTAEKNASPESSKSSSHDGDAETEGSEERKNRCEKQFSTLLSLSSFKDEKIHTFASLDSSEDQIQQDMSVQDEVPESILAPSSMDEVSTKTVVNLDTNASNLEQLDSGSPISSVPEEATMEDVVVKDQAVLTSVESSTDAPSTKENISEMSETEDDKVEAEGTGDQLNEASRATATAEPAERGVSKRSTESDMEITIPDTEASEEMDVGLFGSDFGSDDEEVEEEFKQLFALQQRILHEYRKGSHEAELEAEVNGAEGDDNQEKDQRIRDDGSESTDSSQKLRDYSKKYFLGDAAESMDYNSVEESGINLEPSIVTHASSITHEEISVGNVIQFSESFDNRMLDVSADAPSFELENELDFHERMNAPSNGKDHSPVQPSRKISTTGEEFGNEYLVQIDERQHVVDHSPVQPSRKVSVEDLKLAPEALASPPLKATDHAPAQPMRQASVDVLVQSREAGDKVKHDTPPMSPVRVASVKNLGQPDSLRKARAKKLTVAARGQYVMWLTRSRTITFRKTAQAPKLSWFVRRAINDDEAESSFDSIKQQFREYISPTRRRTESNAMARLESAKLKVSKRIRGTFTGAKKAVRPTIPAKRTAPSLTPFLSVPPRFQKKLASLPPRPPRTATSEKADAQWSFM